MTRVKVTVYDTQNNIIESGVARDDETPVQAARRLYAKGKGRGAKIGIGLVTRPEPNANLLHVQFGTRAGIGAMNLFPTVLVRWEVEEESET